MKVVVSLCALCCTLLSSCGTDELSTETYTSPILQFELNKRSVQSLMLQRDLALELGPYYRYNDTIEVPGYTSAKLTYKDQRYKCKMRLKGLFAEHYRDPEKCSYKIKLKKSKRLNDMPRFAIQHPETRGYMNEWYFQKLMGYADLLSINYGFALVQLNGVDRGVYGIEENMSDAILERKNLPKGPILRFVIEISDTEFLFRNIEAYNLDNTDTEQLAYFDEATNKIKQWRANKIEANEVVNVEEMARYFALVELTGHHHSCHLFNLKLYYHPNEKRLHPIPYDNTTIWPLSNEDILAFDKQIGDTVERRALVQWKHSAFYEFLFKDLAFYQAYMKNLERFAQPKFLDDFFNSPGLAEEAMNNISTINISYPSYRFIGDSIMRLNQELIRKQINPDTLDVQCVRTAKGLKALKIVNVNKIAQMVFVSKKNGDPRQFVMNPNTSIEVMINDLRYSDYKEIEISHQTPGLENRIIISSF